MSALTAWTTAEQACFQHLLDSTGSKDGKSGFIGDALPAYTMNIWAFTLSGGPVHDWNYQRAVAASTWFFDGQLIGQFEERETAQKFAGKIMNNMPVYKNSDNPTDTGSGVNRGLPPNVNLFEMTTPPTLDSRPLLVDAKKDKEITVWMLAMQFRCQFSNVQN